MNRHISRRTLIAFGILLPAITSMTLLLRAARSRPAAAVDVRSRGQQIPKTVLWAWERPTNLAFVDPHQVGVAFLARTIRLAGERVIVRPRLQPIDLPHGSTLIAVARVD